MKTVKVSDVLVGSYGYENADALGVIVALPAFRKKAHEAFVTSVDMECQTWFDGIPADDAFNGALSPSEAPIWVNDPIMVERYELSDQEAKELYAEGFVWVSVA